MLFLEKFRRSCIGSIARVYLFHCSERLHFVPTPKLIGQLGVILTSCAEQSIFQKIEVVSLIAKVETSPEVEGNGPLKTQPNGSRTAIGVFFRSASKYSNGRIQRVQQHGIVFDTLSSSSANCCLTQYHFDVSVAVLAQSNGLQSLLARRMIRIYAFLVSAIV